MKERTYTFIEDPGHGWLEVPFAHIEALGIEDQISSCSYRRRDGVCYLEEDCDAPLFINTLKKLGIEVKFSELVYRTATAPLRNYPNYWY